MIRTTGAARAERSPELVERALAAAGGRGCAVLVEERSSVNLRWAMNGLTTNGLTTSRAVTVVVAGSGGGEGTGVGVLTRQGVGAAEVAGLVEQAAAIADDAAPAEDAAPFVDGSGPSGDSHAGGGAGAWEDPAAETGAEVFAPLAEQLGEVFARGAAEERESFGFAMHEVSTTWLATSAGFRGRHVQPHGTVELNGKSHGRSRSTWAGRTSRDFGDVDALALDDEIRTRLAWQERRVELPPGRYDTVLPPTAVADFMAYLYWSSDARSAHEGRTVFSRPGGGTRIGDRLTETRASLTSDPAYAGLECAPYLQARASSPMGSVFDNGLRMPPVAWISDGVLAALPTTRFTAGLTGLPLTPAGDNLVLSVDGGVGTFEDLVAGTERGLLLTCLWYIREVDPQTMLLTGLTRDGVYVIEDGEIVGAANNFRWNESPIDLLNRFSAASESVPSFSREWGDDYFSRTATPALRIPDFNMSSVSQGV
jgi:predicted Zn-dependent protease